MTDRRAEALERLDVLRMRVLIRKSLTLPKDDALRLIEGLRTVLERHRRDPNGRHCFCGECMAYGYLWPCPTARTVLDAILGPGSDWAIEVNEASLATLERLRTGAEGTQEATGSDTRGLVPPPLETSGNWARPLPRESE